MKFENAKVLIAVLSYPFVEPECMDSLMGMWEYSKWVCGKNKPVNDVEWMRSDGTSPARAHNNAICRFLEHPKHYMSLMIIGRDHIFKLDALKLLFEADKDIIAGVTTTRLKSIQEIHKPLYSVVGDYKNGVAQVMTKDECIKKIAEEKNQPWKVPILGNGVSLVKRRVFEKMPAPWFYEPPMPDEQVTPGDYRGTVGCDIQFCNKARELGMELWVHPRVQYVHIGRGYSAVNYTLEN
jgi:hypothetical protein